MKYTILSMLASAIVLVGVAMPTASAEAMNKAELIEAMASEAGLSSEEVEAAFASFADALKKGDRISLVGFGSFSVSKRAELRDEVVPVDFFPDVRRTGAEHKHKGETVTAQALLEDLLGECPKEHRDEKCTSGVFVERLVALTVDALVKGEVVEWGDFGTLESAMASSISKRSARTGRNPQTGKEIKIPAKNTVKFKAGAELSKAVN